MIWHQVLDIPRPTSVRGIPAYHWNSYADQDGVVSIPNYIETHADRLRSRLLAFIYDLGTVRVDKKSIVEHLEVQEDFSLWWMSLLVEKSIYKSPCFFDCLRLLALEELLQAEKPKGVEFVSNDKGLACAIERLCAELDIPFKWSHWEGDRKDRPLSLIRRLYRILPRPIRAILWLARHVAGRWSLRRLREGLSTQGSDITVFSYFIHLDTQSCSQGCFQSRHWGVVGEQLNATNNGVNWLHHYLQSPEVPDVRTGLSWLARFNLDTARQGQHLFVDSFLDIGIVGRTLRNLLAFTMAGLRLRKVEHELPAYGLPIWLWPLIREDFWESVYGQTAAQNLLWIELFDAALRNMPRQRLGLYLYENQGWERAMIHAWRKHRHGALIAVAHATVRYWDLRYFNDPRAFEDSAHLSTPLPDKFAVNGPVARDFLLASGYPENRLVEVEAQRYLSLALLTPNRRYREDKKIRRVLVLGDIVPDSTRFLFQVLEALPENLRKRFEFVVKPHPGNPIRQEEHPGLRFELTPKPLNEILEGFDIVYGANPTSAVVDAYVAGLPVIVQLEKGKINLSPLRGVAGVPFVSNTEELAEALQAAGKWSATNPDRNEYFFLDSDLPRWRRLLFQTSSDELETSKFNAALKTF